MLSIFGKFKFLPGVNELQDEDFEALMKQTTFSKWVKKGIFKAKLSLKKAESEPLEDKKVAKEQVEDVKVDKKSNKKEEK